MTATAWSAVNKGTYTNLSNGNETATMSTTPSGDRSNVLGTTSLSAGKVYFEVTVAGSNNFGWRSGIGNAGTNLNADTQGTANTCQCSYNGTAYGGATEELSAYTPALVAPNVMYWAFNFNTNLFWVSASTWAGIWNGTSSANPATGAVGFAIPSGAGPWFPFFGGYTFSTPDAATLNTSGGFSGAVPSGFTAWDGALHVPSLFFFCAPRKRWRVRGK